ncbi:hypothetical protein C9374_009072 [Naegleria lovaniensis]|uniref:Uncharacterized protein n=1 Tax=Naegleria lovaniensis TaxID=51637 RepID=A0AA88GJD1_NAELO|nr:uncharacterized protein C9374_009072 [Naegleria lovaniensis]KAG2377556.1 hypothetical protein C9374_009072 [Naegleria lovaniensis]
MFSNRTLLARPVGLVHSHFFVKKAFQSAAPKQNMSLSSVIQHMNQQSSRNFSCNNNKQNGSAHHHEEKHNNNSNHKKTEFEELDEILPEPPKREVLLAKIAGASAMFWLLYKMKEDGLIVLGLEKPHWEHPMDDDESDRDDEYFDNALQEDDETIDLKLELHLSTPESNFDKKLDILKFK